MVKSSFVYVIYIRSTAEKVWRALLEPEFTRQYFFGMVVETDWKTGSPWQAVGSDGEVKDRGEIIEVAPPNRLVLNWRNEARPEMKAEGSSRMSYELEQQGEMVKLTLLHEIDRPESKLIRAVSNGWPMILSSLKSLLETGESLEETRTS